MLGQLKSVITSALFGAFVLLFCIAVWSASFCEPPNKEINSTSEKAPAQISCKTFNISSIQLIGIHLVRHPAEVAAIVTAMATGLIAWFTIVLSRIGKQQAHDSRVVQRAYVFIRQPESAVLVDPNNTLVGVRVWVMWKNSGTTPASNMRARISAVFVQREDQFDFGEAAHAIEQPFVLGPDNEVASGYIDIGAQHVIAVLNNQGHQFLSGVARYHDSFPGSREHVVEFCFKVTYEGPLPPGALTIRFNISGAHNRYYDGPG
jgi:hypothetical protein